MIIGGKSIRILLKGYISMLEVFYKKNADKNFLSGLRNFSITKKTKFFLQRFYIIINSYLHYNNFLKVISKSKFIILHLFYTNKLMKQILKILNNGIGKNS